jgi:hypothetical protein
MNNETRKCQFCGEKISQEELECKNCFNKIENKNQFLSKNHGSYNYVIEELEEEKYTSYKKRFSNFFPIRRFFLLIIFTFGLYKIFWFYKNSKLVFKELKINSNPQIRTILLFIPFINIFIYYLYLKDIQNLLKENNLENFSNIWNLIFYFSFPILNIWSVLNIQEHLNEYWRYKTPNLEIEFKFKTIEKIVMILIPLILFGLIISGFLYILIILL